MASFYRQISAWRTGVPPDCVGTGAKPALRIVEGAVLSRTARQRSGKGTASGKSGHLWPRKIEIRKKRASARGRP